MTKQRTKVTGVATPQLKTSIGAVNNTFVAPERNSRGQQIANAFSSVVPSIQNFADRSMAQQQEEDLANAQGLYLQMKEEVANGTVKAVQDSQLFQEQSKAVRTRITQLRGTEAAREARSELQQALREDPSIRMDEARQRELFESFIPEASDDLVFNSSFMKAYGNMIEAESNISRQYRDNEYKKEQMDGLGTLAQEHADTFTNEDGTVDVAGLRSALEGEDQAGLEMGGLSPKENKIAITEALIQRADESLNLNVLDAIPELYKTPALKAKIVQAERSIQSRLDAKATSDYTKAQRAKAEAYRKGSVDIVRAAVDGTLDPEDFRDNPDPRLFELAVKYTTAAIIPPVESVRASKTLQQNIENFVRSDGKVRPEGFPETINKDEILDLVQNDKTMNAAEKMKIMNSIDSILKVDEMQQNRNYKRALTDAKSSIAAIAKAPWASVAEVEGVDYKGELRGVWEDTISDLYQEYVEENEGNEPPNSVLEGFVERADAALDKRAARMEKLYLGEEVTTTSGRSTTTKRVSIRPAIGTIEDGLIFKGGDPAVASNWEKVEEVASTTDPDQGGV